MEEVKWMVKIQQILDLKNKYGMLLVYYQRIMQNNFDRQTIHSGNLYQIFAYVKNKEHELKNKPHEVAGMLLYAKTDEMDIPNQSYQMSGNKISVQSLDLECSFDKISEQLNLIVEENFGIVS